MHGNFTHENRETPLPSAASKDNFHHRLLDDFVLQRRGFLKTCVRRSANTARKVRAPRDDRKGA
jgi:hypothetical protein